MRVEYEISEQDFLNGQRLASRNSSRRGVRWAAFVLAFYSAIGVMVGIAASRKSGNLTTDEMIIGTLVFVVVAALYPRLARRKQRKVYAKSTNLHGRMAAEINDDGLRFYAPLSSSEAKWEVFSSFFEDKTTFVLLQKNGLIFNILPKRELSHDTISALHQLFSDHLQSAKK